MDVCFVDYFLREGFNCHIPNEVVDMNHSCFSSSRREYSVLSTGLLLGVSFYWNTFGAWNVALTHL